MSEVAFTPVEVGDMSEIPPDAPEGAWVASFKVEKKATKPEKGGYPMLQITAILEEALTEGNENSIGQKVSDWLVFFPASHSAAKMTAIRRKAIADALKIDLPRATNVRTWDDIQQFIDDIIATKAQVWTKHETDKESGEVRTKLMFTAPKGSLSAAASSSFEDEVSMPKKKKKSAA